MSSEDAENATAERLRGWGFKVDPLPRREGVKTADFRLTAPGESWVMDVKAREADYRLETEIAQAGKMVEVAKHPQDEKDHPARRLALDAFQKGEKQIEATLERGELGAVWLVVSDRIGMRIDPSQLICGLLGYRQIYFRRKLRPVFAVYPPQFGSIVDVVMIQRVNDKVEAVVNPWTDEDRISRVRSSLLVRSADHRCDARQWLDEDKAWMAPDDTEARLLAEKHLRRVGSPKDVDKFTGRKRRDWQVELALGELYGDDVGTFLRETDLQIVQVIPDDPASE